MFLYDVKKNYIVNPIGIIKIQNVVDYVFSYPKVCNTKPTDVFSFKLPFQKTWFEFKIPKFMNDKNGESKQVNEWAGTEVGILAEILPAEADEVGSQSEYFDEIILSIYIKPYNEATHLSGIKVLIDKQTGKAVDEEVEYYHYASDEMNDNFNRYEKENNQNIIKQGKDILLMMNTIAAACMSMFFNFYHCKNVHLEKQIISEKLVKARKKRKQPFVEKFYTLHIEPMKKIIDEKGGSKSSPGSFHNALTIMRGHFKEYKKDEDGKGGLFGKLEGVWYWNCHIRGDKSGNSGVIHKDYDVDLKSLDESKIESRI